jgi:hypothetical protein
MPAPHPDRNQTLPYVLHVGGHVLLRADPVHVRGANGTMSRSLLILHKTLPSMAEILLEGVEASSPNLEPPGLTLVHEHVGDGGLSSLCSKIDTNQVLTPTSVSSMTQLSVPRDFEALKVRCALPYSQEDELSPGRGFSTTNWHEN